MSNFTLRTITGFIYVAVLILGAIFHSAFLVVFPLLMVLCLYEFFSMQFGKSQISKWLPGIVVSILLFYVAHFYLNYTAFLIPIMLLMSLIVAFYSIVLLFSSKDFVSTKVWMVVFGIVYIGFPFIMLPYLSSIGNQPWYWLITVMALIWIYDSFAYIFGVSFGKHRLYEKVSPKKSWEGAIGGAIVTLIIAYLASQRGWMNEIHTAWFVIFTFIIIIAATLGDLIESMFKRRKGVKDSGSLLPGHGGFYDRLDSFIFSVPILVLLLFLFNFINK